MFATEEEAYEAAGPIFSPRYIVIGNANSPDPSSELGEKP